MEQLIQLAQIGGATEAKLSFSLVLVLLWTIPWKGYALWLAAKRSQKWWFIAILLLNTLAILEIIYVFFVAKKKEALWEFVKNKVLRF